MKEKIHAIRMKVKGTSNFKFNIIMLPLITTLWYIYQININKNILVSAIALIIYILIFTVWSFSIILDLRESCYKKNREKWIQIICLAIFIIGIAEFNYLLYLLLTS